jgi:hypothetical protein
MQAPYFQAPRKPPQLTPRVAVGISSPDLLEIVRALARTDTATVNAVIAACKFYYSGVSLIGLDPSLAYVALVSAIECLAGHHYRTRRVQFEDVKKAPSTGLPSRRKGVAGFSRILRKRLFVSTARHADWGELRRRRRRARRRSNPQPRRNLGRQAKEGTSVSY